ncbi:MAG: ornithine cyclodeaminase [Rhodobacteraceae bacterium]|nr:ornithine cyclodeaminase [Paracoccaceae bacterium]
MNIPHITAEAAEPHLDWLAVAAALEAGHDLPKAQMQDVVLERGEDVMLSRHAWIDGLGALVKTAMIFPENMQRFGRANLNGNVALYGDADGCLSATLDFALVTKWKTAGDSLLAALKLARPDSRNILVLGAGTVARSLIEAYSAGFPDARFTLWNRTAAKLPALVQAFPGHDITIAADLEHAVRAADIVTSGTMAYQPFLRGAWLQPGQHVDLIGAYLPEMREADDEAMRRSRIFVDSYETTVEQIGELIDPIRNGTISRDDILADFHDLPSGRFARSSSDEITLHKNGGGAHLDLMIAAHIREVCR